MRCRAPPNAIQLGGNLRRLLTKIVNAETSFVPVFLAMVDRSDTYMRICVLPDDIPLLAFVITYKNLNLDLIIGFNLYLPIGYIELAQLF